MTEITDGSATFVVRKNATTNDINNVKKQIDSALYFHAGDSFNLPSFIPAAFLTSGNTRIQFSIVLPRRIGDDVKTIIAQGEYRCRQNNNYIAGGATTYSEFKTITTDIVENWSGNIINISIFYDDNKSEYPNSINNDTVGLYLNNVTIAFK